MNVTDELTKYREASNAARTPDVREIVRDFNQRLKDLEVGKNALRSGAVMPAFDTVDIFGKPCRSADLLKNGKLVVTFYRGGWCPYCNIELRGYEELYSQIKAKGTQIVAISPEKPSLGEALAQKHTLSFPIIGDDHNKIADSFGLVFTMSPELVDLYKNKFGIDVEASQGNASFKLPIPATYIVGQDGKILFDFVNTDYTTRLDPADVLAKL